MSAEVIDLERYRQARRYELMAAMETNEELAADYALCAAVWGRKALTGGALARPPGPLTQAELALGFREEVK